MADAFFVYRFILLFCGCKSHLYLYLCICHRDDKVSKPKQTSGHYLDVCFIFSYGTEETNTNLFASPLEWR